MMNKGGNSNSRTTKTSPVTRRASGKIPTISQHLVTVGRGGSGHAAGGHEWLRNPASAPDAGSPADTLPDTSAGAGSGGGYGGGSSDAGTVYDEGLGEGGPGYDDYGRPYGDSSAESLQTFGNEYNYVDPVYASGMVSATDAAYMDAVGDMGGFSSGMDETNLYNTGSADSFGDGLVRNEFEAGLADSIDVMTLDEACETGTCSSSGRSDGF